MNQQGVCWTIWLYDGILTNLMAELLSKSKILQQTTLVGCVLGNPLFQNKQYVYKDITFTLNLLFLAQALWTIF